MIKGVIFDFDGLIVDTETTWYEAFKEVFYESHQINIDLLGYSQCIGTGNDVLYNYFRELAGETVNCEMLEKHAAIRYETMMKAPILREGVKDYLDEAKQNNLKIALASSSSKSWVHKYLTQLNIMEYFEVINTQDDVSNIKPDPELYLKTLIDLGLSREETIVFEDSLNGLSAAKQAGIRCVIVPNNVTKHLKFENFDERIKSMGEISLSELLKRVEQR
ncbi:HAD family hydrolase [Psychrobacillus psychrodurans]|uniref:HAD family hydrolase n=1 Tax=Psychrobacillus psychrodurans TaxID=126157 RepID=UPI001F4DF69D|nr:HAD family hydrolase [Psychrobacillus psychrodurans]MCK1998378.1 HAD family hydrolase [Psychrobacillus psychrodurans]